MIVRMLISVVGAVVVTAGLLLVMDSVTSVFRDRDMQRYFRITDILPKPEPGRPTRPAELGRQPAVPGTDPGTPDTRLEIETPPAAPLAPGPAIRLESPSDADAALPGVAAPDATSAADDGAPRPASEGSSPARE